MVKILFIVMNFIKYNNYHFIQKNILNNVPEETDGVFIKTKCYCILLLLSLLSSSFRIFSNSYKVNDVNNDLLPNTGIYINNDGSHCELTNSKLRSDKSVRSGGLLLSLLFFSLGNHSKTMGLSCTFLILEWFNSISYTLRTFLLFSIFNDLILPYSK